MSKSEFSCRLNHLTIDFKLHGPPDVVVCDGYVDTTTDIELTRESKVGVSQTQRMSQRKRTDKET